MSTKQITAKELQILDPKRFEKEYWLWTERAYPYEWWDYIYEPFIESCLLKGVRVDDITVSGFGSQGDGAAFSGAVDIPTYMELRGLHETYPALYLAVIDDGSRIGVTPSSRNNIWVSSYNIYANQTAPSGVFESLDQQAWEELVDAQEGEADFETGVLKFCKELAAELYKDLEAEYEHLTSEESFIEHCESNEITFDIEEKDHEIYA